MHVILVKMTFQGSMTTEITELKNQIEQLENQVDEGERTKSSLEEQKVSLEMKMAEVEEQKEGKFVFVQRLCISY